MAINLICPECNTNLSVRSKICKNCGYEFRNGKKYRVVVKDQNGKRISKVLDSISIAKKYERKLKTQILENSLLGIKRVSMIDAAWQKYLEWAKEAKKSWKDDDMRWKCHVESYFAGKKMNAISGFDVQRVINAMKSKKDYAPASLKHVIVLIKRVFNWAAEMDLYSGQNPASKIKLPKLNNEITECLSKNEISRLLKILDNWVNQRAALLVKFALFTGLRRGELFNLKWVNVDRKNGWIYLSDTKSGKDSYLPISNQALKILNEAKKHLPYHDCQWVFPNRHGNKRTTISKIWNRIKKRAKITNGFRFHGLRHTYASYLASSGKISQYTLQKLLSHKTPQMTQRYAHLFDETLREGANLLPKLF
jgi:integrase